MAKSQDRVRQARLLCELGEIAEREGDEPAAARDYLAAFNADPSFREPLEALVRLLERRRSLKNLGRVVDALVRAAVTPAEKARALVMRAAFLEDVQADVEGAKGAAREATDVENEGGDPPLPVSEASVAWLALELIAAKLGDPVLREEALAARAKRATDLEWKALLLTDVARMAASTGEIDRALEILADARAQAGPGTFAAARAAERLVQREPGLPGSDEAKQRGAAYAGALEAQAGMMAEAIADAARGDALGVPLWTRDTAHVVDAWLRAADSRQLLGDTALAASSLDRAVESLGAQGEGATAKDVVAEGALINARMRVAERMGDTKLAATLAERRLASEEDPATAAALHMRVAEHAASEGDVAKALAAVGAAVQKDPACAPARALQLDILADTGDAAGFAAQLEGLAESMSNEDARGRAFLLAATVWALRAGDAASAKAALSQATMTGIDAAVAAKLGRTLASATESAAWFDESSRRLLASAPTEDEAADLWFDLLRGRLARGETDGAKKALAELASLESWTWLGRALDAFLPPLPGEAAEAYAARSSEALDGLAAAESDPARARALRLVAALRMSRAAPSDADRERKGAWPDEARAKLRALFEQSKDDALLGVAALEVERASGDAAESAIVAEELAEACADAELAAALRIEAGLTRWRGGDKRAAIEAFEAASAGAPRAASVLLAWAARAVDPDNAEARRRAITRALAGGGDDRVLALERFAVEALGGDAADAEAALAVLDESGVTDFGIAGSIARLIWPDGAATAEAVDGAIARLAGAGAPALAAAERHRRALGGDAEGVASAARSWFESGGGLAAGLEWLAGAVALGDRPAEEASALRALASSLEGEARESIEAAALLLAHVNREPHANVPLSAGDSAPSRLTNLELSPPGSDPRRRATALCNVGDVLGTDAQADAMGLGAWSLLAAGDVAGALEAFRAVCAARPDDLASWEGLRVAAIGSGDATLHAQAAQELGSRCADGARGAAFWEEAASVFLEAGDEDSAEAAFDAAFERDPTRANAFDKLFRRVRERKDGPRLLAIIERRLAHTDDPPEVAKLFWEQARVLREKGDNDAALQALENVTMIEPDHVGALALSGEIFIRRAQYAEGADRLGRLAKLDGAPVKNRLTAGVAAVDLFENKLDQPARGLEILLALHRAGLSTLPVRERLAKSAARNESWEEATSILEQLMKERADQAGRIDAARLAMVIYRDKLRAPARALDAVVKLLEEAPGDREAIDLLLSLDSPSKRPLLERAKGTLLAALAERPSDAAGAELLSRVAQGVGDTPLEEASIAVARALGGPNPVLDQALARFAARRPRVVPQVRITPQHVQLMLAPGDAGPVADLFALLGPTLTEALGPSLEVLGVGKRDRVDAKSGLPLRNELVAWAGAFGIDELEVYIGGKDPLGVQGIPSEVPALVVGTGVSLPLSAGARGRLARELFGIVRGTTILRSRDDTTIAAIVVAACKLADLRLEAPAYAMQAEIDKQLGKAIARKTKKLLPDICNAIVSSRPDPRAWARQAALSQARASVVAAGDLSATVGDLLPPATSSGDPRLGDLARFVLSSTYFDVRRSLGLDGAS